MNFDYGVIGGGPAGYTTALQLVKRGFSVVLFEKDKLGGTCLNKGCIPTKSLLHSSEVYKQVLNSANYGFDLEIKTFDFKKVAEKRDATVEKLRKGLELVVKNSGVNVVYAQAEKISDNEILANDERYFVKNIICATGSLPREVKGLDFDNEFILNSDDVLKLDKLPAKVLIVGSGAIGIEWARIFSNFGVQVVIVELSEHLIPLADIEVSKRIERIFKQNKIKFYLNDCIEKIENKVVTLKTGVTYEPDFVLSAVGRIPLLNGEFENIIGDANGEMMLAHYAIHQGINLALGKGLNLDKKLIPSVIYGEPEIAWVGLREQDCDETYKKIVLPVSTLGKSWADDATEGFIKLIVKDDLILGAHIVSKEASALLQQILIAMQNKISIEKLKEVCFAHPTFSEGIFEALQRL